MVGLCFASKWGWFSLAAGDGDRICSDHFILKQKSDIPINPNYVLSIQSPCSSESPSQMQERDQLSRFERSQRRSRMVAHQRESQELQIVNDFIAYRSSNRLRSMLWSFRGQCHPSKTVYMMGRWNKLSCTVIWAVINWYALQLYDNRFWSTYLYSVIISHKKEKFVS